MLSTVHYSVQSTASQKPSKSLKFAVLSYKDDKAQRLRYPGKKAGGIKAGSRQSHLGSQVGLAGSRLERRDPTIPALEPKAIPPGIPPEMRDSHIPPGIPVGNGGIPGGNGGIPPGIRGEIHTCYLGYDR